MGVNWTDIEQFVLQRWDDVQRLRDACASTEEKIEEVIEAAGSRLTKWLESEGYRSRVDTKWGEFYAFRESWCYKDKARPLVRLTVGGFCPNGYYDLDCRAPYLWVYLSKADAGDAFGRNVRRNFSARLREELRADIRNWNDGEVDGVTQPLGQYLIGYDERRRCQLASDPDALYEFAKEHFPKLLALSDAIETTLRTTLGREG